jgi:hypothetical protein
MGFSCLGFLSQLLDTAGLNIVISGRTLLHLPATSGGTYAFKQHKYWTILGDRRPTISQTHTANDNDPI